MSSENWICESCLAGDHRSHSHWTMKGSIAAVGDASLAGTDAGCSEALYDEHREIAACHCQVKTVRTTEVCPACGRPWPQNCLIEGEQRS